MRALARRNGNLVRSQRGRFAQSGDRCPCFVLANGVTLQVQPRHETQMPTVLITGCDEGLGRGFAEAYAGDGWDVIATYRDLANRWGQDGAIRHLALDVTRPSDFLALKERIGGAPIDILISNAAIAIDPMRLGAID